VEDATTLSWSSAAVSEWVSQTDGMDYSGNRSYTVLRCLSSHGWL